MFYTKKYVMARKFVTTKKITTVLYYFFYYKKMSGLSLPGGYNISPVAQYFEIK